MSKNYSLNELCKKLSISYVTGRNWIKLGKINSDIKIEDKAYFSEMYVEKLLSLLNSEESSFLKGRRNKKYVLGNRIYKDYLPEDSENSKVIQEIVDYLEEHKIKVSKFLMRAILVECAIQLYCEKESINVENTSALKAYFSGNFDLGDYANLIDDLLLNKDEIACFIDKYPDLFQFKYKYVETEDVLGLLYMSLQQMSERKTFGAYYTPTRIVQKLIDNLLKNGAKDTKTFLDPCCGTGNFLLQLPKNIDFEYIFANEIDEISVILARINMALKYSIYDKAILSLHIRKCDYLTKESSENFDFILGNPPWGFDFSEENKKFLRNKYFSAEGESIESYDVFVEQSIKNLKKTGMMSFILPEAILNVHAHFNIRKFILDKCNIKYLEFLGEVFDGVQCPSIILQLEYTGKPLQTSGMQVQDLTRNFVLNSDRNIDAECFSFHINDLEYEILQKIAQSSGMVYLKDNSKFALGIVTGNNKQYISKVKTQGNEHVLKGSNVLKYKLVFEENYIDFQPKNFQQVAPVEFYRAKEKLLYRFISNKLVFAYDDNQTLSLNSCNILIPEIKGLEMKYVMAILNSRIAQFIFEKRFNSVKVLRSHIESIPIPLASEDEQLRIVAYVDEIMNDYSRFSEIYEILDKSIADLYKLSEAEYSYICSL